MNETGIINGAAGDVADYLHSAPDVNFGNLVDGLVNAMRRIAAIERALIPAAPRPALPPGPVDVPVPPPWFVIGHPGGSWTIQDRPGGGGRCVAQSYGDSGLSNAYLLAAAPELARALTELMPFVRVPDGDGPEAEAYQSAGRRALAALAKARIEL